MSTRVRPASAKLLKEGMPFAFDGFHACKRADGTEKTISLEEMLLSQRTVLNI